MFLVFKVLTFSFFCCLLLLSPHQIAATVNERMNKPPTDATIGTTILFFFLHKSDPQRLEFPSILATTGFMAAIE
jgi:hypothetical protein